MQFSRNMNCSPRVCPLDQSVVYGFSAGSMPWLRSVNTIGLQISWASGLLGTRKRVSPRSPTDSLHATAARRLLAERDAGTGQVQGGSPARLKARTRFQALHQLGDAPLECT